MCILGFNWIYVLTALIFITLHAYGSAIRNERVANVGALTTGVVILAVFLNH